MLDLSTKRNQHHVATIVRAAQNRDTSTQGRAAQLLQATNLITFDVKIASRSAVILRFIFWLVSSQNALCFLQDFEDVTLTGAVFAESHKCCKQSKHAVGCHCCCLGKTRTRSVCLHDVDFSCGENKTSVVRSVWERDVSHRFQGESRRQFEWLFRDEVDSRRAFNRLFFQLKQCLKFVFSFEMMSMDFFQWERSPQHRLCCSGSPEMLAWYLQIFWQSVWNEPVPVGCLCPALKDNVFNSNWQVYTLIRNFANKNLLWRFCSTGH